MLISSRLVNHCSETLHSTNGINEPITILNFKVRQKMKSKRELI